MNTTDVVKLQAKEIERLARNVQPGAWSVDTEKPLSTLLGSCVAVCLFDPALKIGGINHFMLPEMGRSKYGDVDSLLSGNFAMEALLNALIGRGARKARLQAKAFGGGTIIDSDASAPNIGMRNASFDLVIARPSDYPARGVRDYGYSAVTTTRPGSSSTPCICR